MKKSLVVVLCLVLLTPSVAAFDIAYDPPSQVRKGTPIEVQVRIAHDAPIVRVELYSYYENIGVIELKLEGGTADNGIWVGTIPALNKTGTLHFTIDAYDSENQNKVWEYSIDVYGTDAGGTFLDLPDDPWVLWIGGGMLIIALVLLEVLFRRRLLGGWFFWRRHDEEDEKPRRKARKVKKK